ncbi:cell division control protein 6 homolog [Tribolium castaneum]|uniref:Cell division control protein n=1 Tax=Tribolium castaneum TaxID=7070 RepID=D6WJU9_TRICA|nr:PREDICTED: cell division control protein 6 homolog [Tribolium castaneum]EFA03095.1 Cell division control protein 6 homolog-like Protein [Tribolium castaneum]|eukprot:XP_001813224.1 PREDICTED: cell division control protein 6 homolog [Tribolium castaneum]
MTPEPRTRKSTRLHLKQTSSESVNTRRRTRKPIIISDSEEENVPETEKSPFKKPPNTPYKTKSRTPPEDRTVTPPKQRKMSENNENLQTPPSTPTILLERLSLLSPNEKSNRKKLFQEDDLYQNARRALHSSCPTNLPGREKELGDLKQFILQHLDEGTSGTLYISGPPGTGKTASLNLVLEDPQISSGIEHVYVNCTSIKSSGSIFSRIAKDLGIKASGKSEKDYVGAIEKFLQKGHRTILLVLDEIDQLESKKQSVLYTIFEWPANPNSRLILIGIANALDLTDRILPRLQARCELKPQLMHFAPYTKQQIVEIFTNRLKNANVLDIFSPIALQMLAGKVAAISGDVRRALDIGRRVIEMSDKKKRGECVLKSVENLATELEEKKLESVDMRQVVQVLNRVYGTTQSLDEEVEDSFPLQQKIIVCSLLLILKKAKNKDVTIGRLHDVYRRVCAKRNIQVVDQGEFVGLCSLIETRGMVKIIKKKDPRMNKVSLVWDEGEVSATLRDKQLMSMILQDDSCLGKM